MRTAVCLTGMERSFAEIGANIREGLARLLGAATLRDEAVFFGVRPAHDPWTEVRALLPFADARLETQRRCWSAGSSVSSRGRRKPRSRRGSDADMQAVIFV